MWVGRGRGRCVCDSNHSNHQTDTGVPSSPARRGSRRTKASPRKASTRASACACRPNEAPLMGAFIASSAQHRSAAPPEKAQIAGLGARRRRSVGRQRLPASHTLKGGRCWRLRALVSQNHPTTQNKRRLGAFRRPGPHEHHSLLCDRHQPPPRIGCSLAGLVRTGARRRSKQEAQQPPIQSIAVGSPGVPAPLHRTSTLRGPIHALEGALGVVDRCLRVVEVPPIITAALSFVVRRRPRLKKSLQHTRACLGV